MGTRQAEASVCVSWYAGTRATGTALAPGADVNEAGSASVGLGVPSSDDVVFTGIDLGEMAGEEAVEVEALG